MQWHVTVTHVRVLCKLNWLISYILRTVYNSLWTKLMVYSQIYIKKITRLLYANNIDLNQTAW